jgi:phosphate transport system substrate-binding protein
MDKRALCAAALLCLLPACASARAAGVVAAGSTSVQPYAELLAQEFEHTHPELAVDIQGGGSSAGVAAARSGAADIGMSSRALRDDELELWSVEIAKDGLAIIVHPDNPCGGLTSEQIRAVYSAEITRWSELGGADAKINVIAREEGSGTRSAFEELLMKDKRITPRAIVQNSNGQISQLVAGDRHSIGFISLGLVDSAVKALRLDGVVPARENVINGTYSLFRPFLFVAREPPSGPSELFIDFVMSEAGRRLLGTEGLITPGDGP